MAAKAGPKKPTPKHLLVALGLEKPATPMPGMRPPLTGQAGAPGADMGLNAVQEMVGHLIDVLQEMFPQNPAVQQVAQLLDQILQTPAHMPSGPELPPGMTGAGPTGGAPSA